jgi:tetratricopeptide (TPR) repeat protein
MKTLKLIIILLAIIRVCAIAEERTVTTSSSIRVKSSPESQQDTAVINDLIRKGAKYLSSKQDNRVLVKAFIDSALLICENKNIEIPPRLHLLHAEYHFATGDLRSASEEADIAIRKSTGSGEYDVLAKTNFFLGKYYQKTGSYSESIESFNNAISISRKEKIKGLIPRAYYGQHDVYLTIGDLKGERRSLQLMIDAAYDENDPVIAKLGYQRLGYSYLGDTTTSAGRNFRTADSLLRKSLEVSTIKIDTASIATTLTFLGWNFYLEKMYDSSIFYFEKSLKFYSLPGKLHRISGNSYGNLGTIYRDLMKPEKAIGYYKKGIEQAKMAGSIFDLWWIYRDMSYMYLQSRDTSNAFRNYVLFKKYSDIYISKGNLEGLADAKMRYEAETHNKEVELLSLRLKNNRLLNYGFAGFIFLISLIGFLFFRGSKLKDKRRISEMNRKISEITQANLRQQMNPHFIFNTLNSIQYYMYQHDKLATNNYLTKFSSLMRKVLDNSQHTSVPIADELSALNLYLELESLRFKDKFDYKINIDEEIDPLMHKVPTMLIQPYVENSICHGLIPMEGKGYVNIDLKLNSEFILCTIEDNGIGREAAKVKNQNREGNNHNSLGTRITASRLNLVNEMYGTTLQTIYTDLKNDNGEPVGTRVEIHIPIIL